MGRMLIGHAITSTIFHELVHATNHTKHHVALAKQKNKKPPFSGRLSRIYMDLFNSMDILPLLLNAGL